MDENATNETEAAYIRTRKRAMPPDVLRQFDAQVHHMTSETFLSIALLVRSTGWRVNEILDLRIETCLERDQYGWWVRSNRADKRRVPIPVDTALAVEAQILRAREGKVGEANPNGYVFVNCGDRGTGKQIVDDQVRTALQKLARDRNITDSDGQLYPLTAGGLRRAKYVEMVRSGMDLLSIQHWMNDESIFIALDYVRGEV